MNLPLPLRLLLWPLSALYGQVTRWRAALYAKGILKSRRLNRPVISIGNLTVGGTGKTPMVIWLAERLMSDRRRVGILSRGYKGTGETCDEIELIKSRLHSRPRFGVGPNRYQEGTKLESSVDVFILDDGFQHLQLARDVDILLIDASQPLGKEIMLPTGRLREPVSAMTRADLLVFTRTETVAGTTTAIEKFHDYPVFSAATRLQGFRRFGISDELLNADQIGPGPFYAFCGIGNPRAFFQDLKNWNIPLAGQSEFRDHHYYDARDASEIEVAAHDAGATAILTTEKDAQNLTDATFSRLSAYVVVIDLEISKEAALLGIIREKLQATEHVA